MFDVTSEGTVQTELYKQKAPGQNWGKNDDFLKVKMGKNYQHKT